MFCDTFLKFIGGSVQNIEIQLYSVELSTNFKIQISNSSPLNVMLVKTAGINSNDF